MYYKFFNLTFNFFSRPMRKENESGIFRIQKTRLTLPQNDFYIWKLLEVSPSLQCRRFHDKGRLEDLDTLLRNFATANKRDHSTEICGRFVSFRRGFC